MAKKNTSSHIGAGKIEDRNHLDFYPTPSDVTIALMDFLKLPKGKIWEPACGDGAMAKVIERYGHLVWPTDIRDTEYSWLKHDFLATEVPYCFDAVITNPPFNNAHKFIKEALRHSNIVCMLLKSQYWHAASRVTLFNKYKPSWVLPLTWRPDFTGEGASQMDVLWTVWMKDDQVTKYMPLHKPRHQTNLFDD